MSESGHRTRIRTETAGTAQTTSPRPVPLHFGRRRLHEVAGGCTCSCAVRCRKLQPVASRSNCCCPGNSLARVGRGTARRHGHLAFTRSSAHAHPVALGAAASLPGESALLQSRGLLLRLPSPPTPPNTDGWQPARRCAQAHRAVRADTRTLSSVAGICGFELLLSLFVLPVPCRCTTRHSNAVPSAGAHRIWIPARRVDDMETAGGPADSAHSGLK